jgi:hypothetical protein
MDSASKKMEYWMACHQSIFSFSSCPEGFRKKSGLVLEMAKASEHEAGKHSTRSTDCGLRELRELAPISVIRVKPLCSGFLSVLIRVYPWLMKPSDYRPPTEKR